MGRPRTSSNGLGVVSVWGRSRVPSPAARMIASIRILIFPVALGRRESAHVGLLCRRRYLTRKVSRLLRFVVELILGKARNRPEKPTSARKVRLPGITAPVAALWESRISPAGGTEPMAQVQTAGLDPMQERDGYHASSARHTV